MNTAATIMRPLPVMPVDGLSEAVNAVAPASRSQLMQPLPMPAPDAYDLGPDLASAVRDVAMQRLLQQVGATDADVLDARV